MAKNNVIEPQKWRMVLERLKRERFMVKLEQ